MILNKTVLISLCHQNGIPICTRSFMYNIRHTWLDICAITLECLHIVTVNKQGDLHFSQVITRIFLPLFDM